MNRHDIELPHGIKLFYTTKDDSVTITLDLTQAKFKLSTTDQQRLAELPIKRNSQISSKKAILNTVRGNLLDVLVIVFEILTLHVSILREH